MKTNLRARLWENLAVCFGMVATFLVVNYIHFMFFEVRVIFYACVIDLLIASVSVLSMHVILRRRSWESDGVELALSAIIGGLCILLYSVLGPTVVDRSLSIYILEKIDQRGGAVAEAAIPAIFVEEYMAEYRLVDVRLTEQLQSHTLTLDRGCLRLTPRGRALVTATQFYRAHFLPRRRVLMGEVTDQLTHPFQHATRRVDTTCPTQ